MTKPLSKEEKKKRKEARKSNQQKPASTTKTTVNVPKAEAAPPTEDPTPSPGLNLCDTCAYEFGECEGTPKFGEEEGADNVVECRTWTNVEDFPTAQETRGEAAAPGPAAADQGEGPDAAHDGDDKGPNEPGGDQGEPRVCDVEHLGNYPDCFRDCPKDECDGKAAELVHENVKEGATEEDKEADRAVMLADLPDRPDPKRFLEDKTDYGTCPACERPLKRTALNRYRDAIRCTNPRCPQYRAVVKTVGTGVK